MAATHPRGSSGHVVRPGSMPLNMKMELLELLKQQAWRKQKTKQKAEPESTLEVEISNGQWVAKPQ